ncbi:MAG TPA: 3-deoxy-7-phosphoheptulonate synthase [Gammaproteobacteria bacterium]|nr:3-deoxy-7-phosphoheptulonate synthase [Gammaproteobacteria bacterium]
MNYTIIKKLPPVEEMLQSIPLSDAGYKQIQRDREEIKDILAGKDDRLLIIVGPCSAWPKEAVLEYAAKLLKLNRQVKHALKLIMRVYIQKPRTTKGWTGPVNQPDPFAYPDIEAGVRYTREMMVKVIEMGLPIADEALFTHNARGFLELLSWVAIGARSAEDQEHRIFASAIDCAVGLKNPTHGSLAVGVNSVVAAQHPHVAVFDGYEVQTNGNCYAHLVLRGSDNQPNYSIPHLTEVKRHMDAHQIKNPAVIIDASHDNCLRNGKKDYSLQPAVINEVLDSLSQHPELRKLVKGFMIESFLKAGNQKVDGQDPTHIDINGLSITDPCLGWEQTEKMLQDLADRLSA